MADHASSSVERFTILCRTCERGVNVRAEWAGRDVKCPHCSAANRVPPAPADGRPVRAAAPSMLANRNFNFGCGRCHCLLEAHTGMCGEPARCPTCGAALKIPFINPRTGTPDGLAQVEQTDELPTPMHAYAASGSQAPRIEMKPDGSAVILCPRCQGENPIDANLCKGCGVPFVIEAAATIHDFDAGGRNIAAITFALVGLGGWYYRLFAAASLIALLLGFRGAGWPLRFPRDILPLASIVVALAGLIVAILRALGVL